MFCRTKIEFFFYHTLYYTKKSKKPLFFVTLIFQFVNIGEISSITVIIQPISYNKIGRQFHGYVIRSKIIFQRSGFQEQSGNLNFARMLLFSSSINVVNVFPVSIISSTITTVLFSTDSVKPSISCMDSVLSVP